MIKKVLIGGIFLLVPFLWIMKYEKGRIYDLRPVEINKKNVL